MEGGRGRRCTSLRRGGGRRRCLGCRRECFVLRACDDGGCGGWANGPVDGVEAALASTGRPARVPPHADTFLSPPLADFCSTSKPSPSISPPLPTASRSSSPASLLSNAPSRVSPSRSRPPPRFTPSPSLLKIGRQKISRTSQLTSSYCRVYSKSASLCADQRTRRSSTPPE